jgi:ABC-2 type transport system ATP-binding protein
MSAAVLARDLVKTYPKGVRALDHLSLSVERGEIVALLGPNGAGKSTTVKILTTLARADSGSAVIMGHDVTKKRIWYGGCWASSASAPASIRPPPAGKT